MELTMQSKQIRWRFGLLVIGLVLAEGLGGCGYRLEGRGVFLPQHIQKVAVPVFENKSFGRDLEIVLTNAILQEINRRGGVTLVQDVQQADAVLRGTIEEYRLDVLSADRDGRATAYRISLRASIVFDDLVVKKPYWQNTLSKVQDFQVDDSAASTDVQERDSIQKASEDFAKTLVAAIFLGF
jgi:outer membrane lipopolysaccharide assembly protein LptE/RlpB